MTWCAERGITLASQATHELVDRWLTDRSAVVSRRTVNRDLRAVRVCLRWCAARALVPQGGPWMERKELRDLEVRLAWDLRIPIDEAVTLAAEVRRRLGR